MKRKLCVVKEVIRKLKKMWDPSHACEQELKLGKFKINFPYEKGSYLLQFSSNCKMKIEKNLFTFATRRKLPYMPLLIQSL